MNVLKGNKTTWLGVLAIAGALIGGLSQFLSTGHVDFAQVGAAVVAGIGLIHAADAKQ